MFAAGREFHRGAAMKPKDCQEAFVHDLHCGDLSPLSNHELRDADGAANSQSLSFSFRLFKPESSAHGGQENCKVARDQENCKVARDQENCKVARDQEDRHSCLSFSARYSQTRMSGLLKHGTLRFSCHGGGRLALPGDLARDNPVDTGSNPPNGSCLASANLPLWCCFEERILAHTGHKSIAELCLGDFLEKN